MRHTSTKQHPWQKRATRSIPDTVYVVRPVGKAGIARTPVAKAAMKKEWDRLRSNYVWDEPTTREWDDVREEAKRAGITVHMAYIFCMCVEFRDGGVYAEA